MTTRKGAETWGLQWRLNARGQLPGHSTRAEGGNAPLINPEGMKCWALHVTEGAIWFVTSGQCKELTGIVKGRKSGPEWFQAEQ